MFPDVSNNTGSVTARFCMMLLESSFVVSSQWLSCQCNGVVVLCGGFHNICLASVDVES